MVGIYVPRNWKQSGSLFPYQTYYGASLQVKSDVKGQIGVWRNSEGRVRKMWHSAQKLRRNMVEFNTVRIVSLENASRFFSGAPVKICHMPVNFFITIAKIFHNPPRVSYVDFSSKSQSCEKRHTSHVEEDGEVLPNCYSNLALKAKSESGEIWRNVWEKCGIQHKKNARKWHNFRQSIL